MFLPPAFSHGLNAKAYDFIMVEEIIFVIHMTLLTLLFSGLQSNTYINIEKK